MSHPNFFNIASMAIELGGSEFGTYNGTTDLVEMSRNLWHGEVTPSFRSRNLVSKRFCHDILEGMPRPTWSTPAPPADATPTEAGVASDLAKPKT